MKKKTVGQILSMFVQGAWTSVTVWVAHDKKRAEAKALANKAELFISQSEGDPPKFTVAGSHESVNKWLAKAILVAVLPLIVVLAAKS